MKLPQVGEEQPTPAFHVIKQQEDLNVHDTTQHSNLELQLYPLCDQLASCDTRSFRTFDMLSPAAGSVKSQDWKRAAAVE